MTLHHDLGWWAFLISIIALLGAYPLSLLANLTSSPLKNWWAERSVTSLRRRIDKLERQLADYEKHELLSEVNDRLLVGVQIVGMVSTVSLFLLDAIFVTTLEHVSTEMPIYPRRLGMIMVFLVAVIGCLAYGILFFQVSQFRVKRSPLSRKALSDSLTSLKKKLVQVGGPA